VLLLLGWHKLGLWEGFGFAAVMVFEFIWFVGNLYSLTWVGLCQGMKTASHARALGRTLLYVLFLPWTIVALSAAAAGVATIGRNFSPAMAVMTIGEFLMALAICNLGFTGWAVSELRDDFRLLAASQTISREPPASPWKSILAKLRSWPWKRMPRALPSP
jgi:hypothetical protein